MLEFQNHTSKHFSTIFKSKALSSIITPSSSSGLIKGDPLAVIKSSAPYPYKKLLALLN